ncbi:MAG: hypothetical protein KatS3mg117_3248 [Geminicoccaceae bacterium]|nr:MAG: hypothetical protein KatS3mg117_3248 [Geminicoccaceae bacterium]
MRPKRVVLGAVAILAGVLGGLIVAEIVLRLATDPVHLPLDLEASALLRYRLDWHHDRPPGRSSVDIARAPVGCTEPSTRIYIGGDSWVQSQVVFQSFVDTIAMRFSREMEGRCAEIINTGTGSFAPTTITAKLIAAMKEHGRADLIVIHIDETDLMDEWVRYRPSRVEASDGRTIAVVPFVPDLPEMIYYAGLSSISARPLYTLRFAEYMYLRYVLLPGVRLSIARLGMLPDYKSIMAPQREGLADGKYDGAVKWFEARVKEMIQRLRNENEHVPVVITTHPHFLHLINDESKRYRFRVANVLQDVLERSLGRNVHFSDAASNMEGIYGRDLRNLFRWPSDLFSHLTPEAEERFGAWLASECLRYLKVP